MLLPAATQAAPAVPPGNPRDLSQTPSLTLAQCLELAYQNSQQLKIAAKNVAKAREGVKQAQAGFWPTLDYQIGYQGQSQGQVYAWQYIPDYQAVVPVTGPQQGYGATVTVTQPLYTAGKLQNGLKLAQMQLNTMLEEERKVKQNLTYQVKEVFYQVWVAEKMLIVAQDSLQNMDRHVAQVQKFKLVGTASKYDLSRAEVQRDSLKPMVIKAENAVALVKLSLATRIGMDKDLRYTVAYDSSQLKLPGSSASVPEGALEKAYANRPELKEIAFLKQANSFKRSLAEAQYKPNLVLRGNYQGGDIVTGNYAQTFTYTLAFVGTLHTGGATKAQVTSAKEDEEIAALQESGLKDQIRLEVQQAIQTIKESLATIQANQANISLAKDTLNYTQSRFDAGLATTMDIRDSQLALDQASNGYYQGIAAYLTALAKLDLVMGADQ